MDEQQDVACRASREPLRHFRLPTRGIELRDRQQNDVFFGILAEFEAKIAAFPWAAKTYDVMFNAAAASLLVKVFARQPLHGFYHWDASLTLAAATPLFTRAEVMAGLRKLAPYRNSTLLITNLRPALIPPARRATARRKRDYEEAVGFINDLAAARTVRDSNLQLLFL